MPAPLPVGPAGSHLRQSGPSGRGFGVRHDLHLRLQREPLGEGLQVPRDLVSDKVARDLKTLAQWLALEPEVQVVADAEAARRRPNLTQV